MFPSSATHSVAPLIGGGAMGQHVRKTDWSSTPLGDYVTWPQSLRSVLSMVLNAKGIAALLWGAEQRLFYNDAFGAVLGDRHPWAFGRSFTEAMSDLSPSLAPRVAQVLGTGEGLVVENQSMLLLRRGKKEETIWTCSFSPVQGETGGFEGVLLVATETSDQQLAKQEFRASEERHLKLLQQLPGLVGVLTGPAHIYEYVNDLHASFAGPREYLGRSVRDVFPELVGTGLFELLDQVYATGEPYAGRRTPFRLANETSERYLDLLIQPIRDTEGDVTGIFVGGYEVTEMHVAEIALRESKAFNRRVLASSDDCIKVLDLDARLTFMSEGGQRVMEVSDFNAIEGCPWPDFWEGQGHLDAKAAVAAAKAGQSAQFQGHAPTMAGTRRYWDVRVTPILGEDNQPEKILSISRDITAAWQAEMALRTLNESLEERVLERTAERDQMWNTSPDLMLIIDFRGVFRRVNPAWTTLLGYASDELVDHHVNEFVIPDDHDETTEAYELAADGGQPRIENRYRHKDGTVRWISWAAAPAGDMTYATGRDITASKEQAAALSKAEEALHQSQKMEMIGQLTGGVAHDFNNLLTVIRSSTDLLKRPDLPEVRRQRYIGAISDTVTRAAKLTGQLLAFARRQALQPKVFDVGAGIQALADMLGTLTGSRITIVTDLPDAACFVNADPSQFDTAIVNMAVNARDAMQGEGRLAITVRPITMVPAIRSHPPIDGDFVAVRIEDTGAGISAEQIDRIFEPFFTTKDVGKGTGLGLSQVFGFAKQSGGDIQVESEAGRGATFVLYLPRVAAKTLPSAAEPEPLVNGEGTRVLVVEDNLDVGAFTVQSLTDLGYTTVLAADGNAALAELAKGADRFDVVFSDVVMPGMSGIELGQEIRRLYHDLPVVLTSGYSHVLAENGTYGFELLHKPYSVEQLSRVLNKAAIWQRRKRLLGR